MAITIRPDLEIRLRRQAESAHLSVEAYLEQLILEDSTEPPLDESDPEMGEIRAAVEEGLAQLDRGEAVPAAEVFAELRVRAHLTKPHFTSRW